MIWTARAYDHLVIASLLLSIAVPAYDSHIQRARNSKACGDVGTISVEIERFRLRNLDRIPDILDELDIDVPVDPLGEPYQYVKISALSLVSAAFVKTAN